MNSTACFVEHNDLRINTKIKINCILLQLTGANHGIIRNTKLCQSSSRQLVNRDLSKESEEKTH